MVFGQIGGMGGDFVGDDFGFYVVLVGQVQMFFGCDIVQYCCVELIDYCCVDVVGDVVVIWCDVGGQWFQCVEWCFVVDFKLFCYVFVDFVYGYMVGVFDYYLIIVISGDVG